MFSFVTEHQVLNSKSQLKTIINKHYQFFTDFLIEFQINIVCMKRYLSCLKIIFFYQLNLNRNIQIPCTYKCILLIIAPCSKLAIYKSIQSFITTTDLD